MEALLPRAIACYLSQAAFNATDSKFPIVVTVTVEPGILSFVLALRLGQIRLSGLTGLTWGVPPRLVASTRLVGSSNIHQSTFFPPPSDLRPRLRPRNLELELELDPTLPLPPSPLASSAVYTKRRAVRAFTDRKICAVKKKRSDPGNCGEYFFFFYETLFFSLSICLPFHYPRIAAQRWPMRCDAIPNSDARNFYVRLAALPKARNSTHFSSRLCYVLWSSSPPKKSQSSVLASTSN